MPTHIPADVVNAVLEAAVALLERCGAAADGLERPVLVHHLPLSPYLTVRLELRGPLHGPIVLGLEPALAATLAQRLFGLDTDTAVFPGPDALGEVGNILVGHASGALRDQGYGLELLPPEVGAARSTPEALPAPGHAVELALRTPRGRLRLLVAAFVREAA